MRVLVVCLALALAADARKLPEALRRFVCRRSDPQLSECLLKNVRESIPVLVAGIPDARIPPLDPMNLPVITVEGQLPNFGIKLSMKNITVVGQRDVIINKFKLDPYALRGEFSFSFPTIRMMTDYYASGRLFNLPLESNAQFDAVFDNTDIALGFTLKETEKKGVKHFDFDKLKFQGRIGKAQIITLKSFNEDFQPAVDLIKNFFNENDRLVMDTINPLFNQYVAEFYKQVLGDVLRYIPSESLLPQ